MDNENLIQISGTQLRWIINLARIKKHYRRKTKNYKKDAVFILNGTIPIKGIKRY